MKRPDRETIRNIIIIAALILIAVLCRNIGRVLPGRFLALPRSFIYVGLFMGWGISLHRRVVQKQARSLLTGIAALMVFWIADRTIKYLFVSDPAAIRYLWYMYYLPMLLIPFLAVLAAASLGKTENYRLPGWTKALYIPALGLVLLVLTNDLHQQVFRFPEDAVIWKDSEYTRQIGYFIFIGFMAVCALVAMGMMLYKCRRTEGRRTAWLPLIFVPLALIYSVLYAFYIEDHTSLLYYIAGDVTVTLCLLFSGMLESCLLTGLIPTNTGYDRLFAGVSVGMQITDRDNRVCYISDKAAPLEKSDLINAENAGPAGLLYDENTLLKAHTINGGYVVWQEDITELADIKRNLELVKEELSEKNEILREQYRRDAQRYKLEEQNRLYDLVQRETQKQLREIDALAETFSGSFKDKAVPEEEKKKLLLRILILATYIKRHKDMVIVSDRSRSVPVTVLADAIGEACSNLNVAGIDCNMYQIKTEELFTAGALCEAYACFEDILEAALDTLTYLLVSISRRDGMLCLNLTAECGADFKDIRMRYPDIAFESDEYGCTVCIPLKEGERL